MKNTLSLNTPLEIRTFSLKLAEILKEKDNDFRTLGHCKSLHRISEALNFADWHHCLAHFNKLTYFNILREETLLSESEIEVLWSQEKAIGGKEFKPEIIAKAIIDQLPLSKRKVTVEQMADDLSSFIDVAQAEDLSYEDAEDGVLASVDQLVSGNGFAEAIALLKNESSEDNNLSEFAEKLMSLYKDQQSLNLANQ